MLHKESQAGIPSLHLFIPPNPSANQIKTDILLFQASQYYIQSGTELFSSARLLYL